MHYGIAHSALGWALAVWNEQGLRSVDLSDQEEQLLHWIKERFPTQTISPADGQDAELLKKIVTVLENPETPLDHPLALEGTAFQKRVWHALQSIPPGQTITYSELATHLGEPKAVRAVANACGANQLAVIVPCHRVVRSDGGLGGYRWGIERKQALLNREAKLAAIVS
ncbi:MULTISPECIES: methylated-DNA--[protein]-cysteine S-methyltransferase [unclassified Marinobacter]|uniref:methylated-DNA--[protein]-cysteine S-methyltransferase n=1 Tax=unclassified Marinobacter TaxID=83889 RepID=UPI00273C56C0|nr:MULTISPECIES: methylated-DNA--[protein]-cysteine S-methyltransferase [unclassified Marinobacter]MDP4548875.1 methylated-DNA--[protein]-cysteine S-methyltransferase [Marinobacter sp. MDS2]